MSRMAAKFGNSGGASILNSTTASKAGGSGQGIKPKKFCTRGEAFFDFLKSLGYQPPKHQQYEHFEYLFQDEKSANFAKFLMSLKTENCLTPEEIQRYESLKEQGLLLYGSNLEEAVSRKHAINEMYSQQTSKRLAKKEELEKQLEVRMVELQRFKELEVVFVKRTLDLQAKQIKAAYMLGTIENLFKENEREIEIDLKLLNEKMAELDKAIVKLKKDLSVHKKKKNETNFVCQINGKQLLDNEQRLFDIVQDLIRKHGANLIIKEAGYGVDGDPLGVENIKKVFLQFETDFDRLKHCIIFEKADQMYLEIALAGAQGVSNKLEECCSKTSQLFDFEFDVRAKLQAETQKTTNSIAVAVQKEKDELVDRTRETTLLAVNEQFSALTNINTRSKKKLQEFFTVATNVLKAQKLRIILTRNLVKAEAQLYGRLLTNIEQNLAVSSKQSEKLIETKPIEKSDLTSEGQILYTLLSYFGIHNPLVVIDCVPKTLALVKKISWEINKQYWEAMEEKQGKFEGQVKLLRKAHEVQVQIQQQESRSVNKGGSEVRITEAKEYIQHLETKLKESQSTRTTLVKELLKQRESNMQRSKEVLRDFEPNV